MRRVSVIAASFALITAAAGADIVDVRALGDGQQADIFIAFDAAPDLVETRLDGQVLELEIAGPTAAQREIVPAGNAWIARIATRSAGERQLVRLELERGATDLIVRETRNGLRLSWTPVDSMTTPSVEAAAPVEAVSGPAPEPAAVDPVQLATAAPREAPVEISGDNECAVAQAALAVDSWNIEALTVHAECRMADGANDEAIPLLERVIAFEPGRFDAVIALAEANEALGRVAAARALYEQAASVAATDGEATAARARARRLAD